MIRFPLFFLAAAAALNAASPFAGRWDLTITSAKGTYPDWLEVTETGGGLQARVQPKDGSVHAVSSVKVDDMQLLVEFKWGEQTIHWDLTTFGNRIKGSQKASKDGDAGVTGERAPVLKRPTPKAWTKPEPLFNGKDLTGWEPMGSATNNWVAQN